MTDVVVVVFAFSSSSFSLLLSAPSLCFSLFFLPLGVYDTSDDYYGFSPAYSAHGYTRDIVPCHPP